MDLFCLGCRCTPSCSKHELNNIYEKNHNSRTQSVVSSTRLAVKIQVQDPPRPFHVSRSGVVFNYRQYLITTVNEILEVRLTLAIALYFCIHGVNPTIHALLDRKQFFRIVDSNGGYLECWRAKMSQSFIESYCNEFKSTLR